MCLSSALSGSPGQRPNAEQAVWDYEMVHLVHLLAVVRSERPKMRLMSTQYNS